MRLVLISILASFSASLYGQKQAAFKKHIPDTTSYVSFITKFDSKLATKDGYYVSGYVVNIKRSQATQLNGKTIKITGKVSVEKGLGDRASKQNSFDSLPIRQGRLKDTKHIESPAIEIVKAQG